MDNNILSVLESLMKESYFHCEWGIEWEEKQNYIDLLFQFNLENPYQESFTDHGDNQMNNEILPFEFRVIFYDSNLIESGGLEHIKEFPIDYQEGIYYGELFTIVKYLQKLTSKVRLAWREYILSDEEVFKIEWNEDDYIRLRQSLIDTHRYSRALVYLPRKPRR